MTHLKPSPDRLSREDRGEVHRLTPLILIQTAFDRQPDIKASYQRFKSEEARYDFFVVSRDSLTPRMKSRNTFYELRDLETVTRQREHSIEVSVEKRFFDTTELDVGVGMRSDDTEGVRGYRPFVSARLRYPLWVSREKLERTSEEIFRRNELNDAQLGYIERVRERLQSSLFGFYNVIEIRRQLENRERWQGDLRDVLGRLDDIEGRDVSADQSRVEAELANVVAQTGEQSGMFEVQFEKLKAGCGLPFHATLEIVDEPFNPFADATHDELLHMAMETDPEIATLRNEGRNAQVQLDLARRGRWDVSLLMDGSSSLEGAKGMQATSDWTASVGVDVSVVDPRVTESLIRQAEARIERFRQAITARENEIFVDIFEPVRRLETLTISRDEFLKNLPRFEEDFRAGVDEYLAGTLNIDDLLNRRESLFYRQQEISRLTFLLAANITELCETTGKFFELLKVGDEG